MLPTGPRVNKRGRGIDAAIAEAVEGIAAAYDQHYGATKPPEVGEMLRGAERFGARLLELRQRHRVSREVMGAALGMATSQIASYEHGKTHPRFMTLVHIAAYFGVSMNWLMTGEE